MHRPIMAARRIGLLAANARIARPPTYATDGMTDPVSWEPATSYLTLDESPTEFSVRVDATIGPGDTGVLAEGGGSGSGFSLYLFGGVLHAQAGNGAGTSADGTRAVVEVAAPTGRVVIEVSVKAGGHLALYVNGALVGRSVTPGGSLVGSSANGQGQVHNTLAGNPNSWPNNGGVFAGVIHYCRVYRAQSTAEAA